MVGKPRFGADVLSNGYGEAARTLVRACGSAADSIDSKSRTRLLHFAVLTLGRLSIYAATGKVRPLALLHVIEIADTGFRI
jgi:hypothetical protein